MPASAEGILEMFQTELGSRLAPLAAPAGPPRGGSPRVRPLQPPLQSAPNGRRLLRVSRRQRGITEQGDPRLHSYLAHTICAEFIRTRSSTHLPPTANPTGSSEKGLYSKARAYLPAATGSHDTASRAAAGCCPAPLAALRANSCICVVRGSSTAAGYSGRDAHPLLAANSAARPR